VEVSQAELKRNMSLNLHANTRPHAGKYDPHSRGSFLICKESLKMQGKSMLCNKNNTENTYHN
jgi:hypothetical protein